MQVREGQDVIVDAGFGELRELPPASADICSEQGEAHEQRGRVLHVEIEAQVVDAQFLFVNLECSLIISLFQGQRAPRATRRGL